MVCCIISACAAAATAAATADGPPHPTPPHPTPGEDVKEWLAVNTVDFYNAVSVLYGTLEEFCSDRTCGVMSAGSKVGGRRAGGQDRTGVGGRAGRQAGGRASARQEGGRALARF